ncbi:hypothetical protein CI1B_47780 [Bradyrhizobium ivorense]|uniref:Uncharacterized protein n=1 Tax=Bradyrhizobium ivorense TaxID=2511166 RepID=A0A508TFM9_9BRAD|nr:hypothetical protein CI41S_11820 [Bradyrhizobium ivorense]VIO73174.1 hypothetical protein CI1B_47780 [Bradyrhizobium ivorense]
MGESNLELGDQRCGQYPAERQSQRSRPEALKSLEVQGLITISTLGWPLAI